MTPKTLIEALGGAGAVAKAFGYDRAQVTNWRIRGIPARVLLAQPNWYAAMHGKAELVLPVSVEFAPTTQTTPHTSAQTPA